MNEPNEKNEEERQLDVIMDDSNEEVVKEIVEVAQEITDEIEESPEEFHEEPPLDELPAYDTVDALKSMLAKELVQPIEEVEEVEEVKEVKQEEKGGDVEKPPRPTVVDNTRAPEGVVIGRRTAKQQKTKTFHSKHMFKPFSDKPVGKNAVTHMGHVKEKRGNHD